jgi:hypothetical protein
VDKYALDIIGPRKVGGWYYSGYWGQDYYVAAIECPHSVPWITVYWQDGREATHSTAWDPRRDKILVEPQMAEGAV